MILPLIAEALCYSYHHLFGIDVSVLRYFTVYGPARLWLKKSVVYTQVVDESNTLLKGSNDC